MRLILVGLALALLFIISFLVWGQSWEAMMQPGELAESWQRLGWQGAGIGVGLLWVDALMPIPATAVIAGLGLAYGPVTGGLLASVGSIGSGLIGYGICRAAGQRGARLLLGERDLQRAERYFDRMGGWTIALSRWIIVVPEVLVCVAGLAQMPFRQFVLALVVGSVPMCFTYAVVGYLGRDQPVLALVISAVLPALLWFLVRRLLWQNQAEEKRNEVGHEKDTNPG